MKVGKPIFDWDYKGILNDKEDDLLLELLGRTRTLEYPQVLVTVTIRIHELSYMAYRIPRPAFACIDRQTPIFC
jgi:hypothetical protein